MTKETLCPACGAPIEITGQKNAVRCTFCGIGLSIQDEGGEAVIRVLGQPELQKDMVLNPVEEHGDVISGEQFPSTSEVEDAQPFPADERSGIPAMEPGTTGPSFRPDLGSSGAPAYSVGEVQKRAPSGKRWLVIGGAVLIGLILLCVCAAAGIIAIARTGNF